MSHPGRVKPLHIAAVAAGNALEIYDFIIYTFFAIFIGRAFFPTHDPVVSLLLSLATYGIGFITRPIGGLVLGRLGDRLGRKPALLITFALMGVGVLGVAVTPTYGQIGIAAPLFVLAARLVQGFAFGGEIGPSSAFFVECASEGRRGLVGSLASATQGLGLLVASGVATLIALVLTERQLADWGWRLAFAAGVVIVPFGLFIRRSLPETAPHLRAEATVHSKTPWRLVIVTGAIILGGTVNTYAGNYMTTFAMDSLHLAPKTAFSIGIVSGICSIVFSPLGGWLSDRYGRRSVGLVFALAFAALVLPAFALVLARPSPLTLYLNTACLSITGAMWGSALFAGYTESFPSRMRSLAVGGIYAATVTIFGGSTQFMIAALIHWTGQPMVIAWYRLAATAVLIGGILALRESAPARVRRAALAPEAAPA